MMPTIQATSPPALAIFFWSLIELLATATAHQDMPAVADPPCSVACEYSEAEPCGSTTNWGCCCFTPPAYSALVLGDPACGTIWYDGTDRDTDWYELVLTETTDLHVSGQTEFDGLIGLVQTLPPGSGDCSNITGTLDPFVITTPCLPFEFDITLQPGVWWFHVEPRFVADVYACEAGPGADQQWTYVFQLTLATGACCLEDLPYCMELTGNACPGTFLGVGTSCSGPDFDGDSRIDACDTDMDNDGVSNQMDACSYTPPNIPPEFVEPDGSVISDLDGDCDVDLSDFALMQERFTGPNP